MKSDIKVFISFMAGAAAGAVGMWYGVKDYYKKRYEEDVKSVKEAFHRPEVNTQEATSENKKEAEPKPTSKERYQTIAKKYQGNNIYRIDPADIGDNDYPVMELTYYSDGVLADKNNEVVEDPDDIIGKDTLTHFGEYEADCVCVRDDTRKRDIEILADPAKYTDIIKTKLKRIKLT